LFNNTVPVPVCTKIFNLGGADAGAAKMKIEGTIAAKIGCIAKTTTVTKYRYR